MLAAVVFNLLESVVDTPQVILWTLTTGVVYAAFHWLFDTQIWKIPLASHWLGIPDLNGTWDVAGKTLDSDKNVCFEWTGQITITQTWEKICVRLKTATSRSFSISAALAFEQGAGFRLLYNYQNEPDLDQAALATHVGFCELLFAEDLRAADGDYFNSKGRSTFGTMHLVRRDTRNGS